MKDSYQANQQTYETEVIDSSVIDESVLQKFLLNAGRAVALPALQAFEMLIDSSTPTHARASLLAALTYLLMPWDLIPDLIPIAGFSDDLVALTAVINIWSSYMTPQIKERARCKINRWFPS
mgnify:FL=1|tara:strand:+ start:147 stop:512 length:366 start_codon:yes stop_codon:yes gene_type:complete